MDKYLQLIYLYKFKVLSILIFFHKSIDNLRIQTVFALDTNNIFFGLLKVPICIRNWFILNDIIFIQIVSTTKTLCDQASSSIKSTGYIFELTYQ